MSFSGQLTSAIAVGLSASLLFEFLLLVPRSSVCFKRGFTGYFVHSASWLSFFFVCLLLFQRPWFAVLLTTSFQLLLLAVNFVKYRSLREPFILQDFEYFYDMIRHPRLYLPFFGIWNAILGAAMFIALVYGALMLETSLLNVVALNTFLGVISVFLALSLWALYMAAERLPLPTLRPEDDLRIYGLYASFWGYFLAFRRTPKLSPHAVYDAAVGVETTNDLPDLVVVQSESFFDPRVSYPSVQSSVLQHYDRVVKQSLSFGQLKVPAWGANTVRTESSFLTGLQPEQMGIHQFNPYWYLSRNHLPNLVSRLKSLGYKTICIHPYPVEFYRRDLVFPKLGFDQFIDIGGFSAGAKDGQYISDRAVSEKVKQVLGEERGPCFVFTITMENHGPLHLESDEGIDTTAFYREAPSAKSSDLTVYLRHLKNADQMIDQLTQYLSSRARKSYLCWYGDHVPVMAEVYKQMGEPVAETPYFIWCNQIAEQQGGKQDIGVDQLSVELFERTVLCRAVKTAIS